MVLQEIFISVQNVRSEVQQNRIRYPGADNEIPVQRRNFQIERMPVIQRADENVDSQDDGFRKRRDHDALYAA